MVAIKAMPRTAHEQFRSLCCNCKICHSDGRCCNKDRLSEDVCGQKRITHNCERETDCLHQAKHLQHIVLEADIRNMPERLYVVSKHKAPRGNNGCFYIFNYGVGSVSK